MDGALENGIAAFGLHLVRTSALVVAAPFFARIGFASFKVALIVVLTGVSFSVSGTTSIEVSGLGTWGLYALREFAIGFGLALLLQVAMLAARIGGELIGLEMGMQMGAQVDPESGVSTPLIARFYEEVLLIGMLAANGHHWVVRALADSFERAPIGGLRLDVGIGTLFIAFFREMLTAGIAFVAPVIVLMSLVTVVVGLVARTVPQINVLDLSFTLRIGVALLGLVAFAPGLEVLVSGVLGALDEYLTAFLDLLAS
jgi:flagellar biosynthetic protein FliR